MKLILFAIILSFNVNAGPTSKKLALLDILENEKIQLSRVDQIVAENIVNMFKLIEKGYVNQEILSKVQREVMLSKNFSPFIPWLTNIKEISSKNQSKDLMQICRSYISRKEHLPLERVLERMTGNYCRERALEAISRDIEKSKAISDEAILFIQENLKFFLTKKNKKNFAYFIQSQSGKPEILKKLSQDVTTYSVQHEIVPSQEILKDIEINEQITKLIQNKGFNPLQHKNVFYAEYGKLIEQGYRILDSKMPESKISEHYTFLKNYLELNQDHLPVGLCLSRMNDFAKAVFRNGFPELSRDIFKYIVKKNNKEIHEDAIFFYMWSYLFSDDFKNALKIADSYGLLKKPSNVVDARLRFWIAHSLEKTGSIKEAIQLYEEIITSSPLSYYAIMGNKKLQSLKADSKLLNFYSSYTLRRESISQIVSDDIDEDLRSSIVRLRAWAKIDSGRLVKLEMKRLRLHNIPALVVKQPSEKQLEFKSDFHLLHAKIIQESGNHLAAFRYLYQVLDKKEVLFSRDLLEVLYPKPYLPILEKTLKGEQLDPIILLALIRQESVFNPMARSPVGARGLMQLMPTTARRLKKSVSDKNLVNPEINIELGTKYFKGLLKRYDGNLVYVLSAYNAGETRVERWKNLYWSNDNTILKNIEAIPFLETRNYVKLIFRNIFFYKILMDKKDLTDPEAVNKIFDVYLGFNH
jgi:soluble lytic murein transglycosylase